jgi:hypothetical protein
MDIRERVVARLSEDVNAEDGWLSDAQNARPEWHESSKAVYFCGEGSVDVGHMVSIVLDEIEKGEQTP